MAAQVQFTNVDATGDAIYATFNVVLSGSYIVGGDPLNFTGNGTLPATADPAFVGLLAQVMSSNLINVDVWSQGGAAISAANQTGYTSACTKTSNVINPQTGVKLKVAALASPSTSTEHAAGAYEAGYTGDLITGMAVFTKML
jgi:hypothetical protein